MAVLNKITFHWTGGKNTPNRTELEHYHFLFDNNGKKYEGNCAPEDNLNCYDGKYAAHCGGGNTGNIGIAFCGMWGYQGKTNIGNFPLTGVQVEAGFKFAAELCKKYNIPIDKDHVFTHYEFGKAHPKTESYGKPDISFLTCWPQLQAWEIGEEIRHKVRWYYYRI